MLWICFIFRELSFQKGDIIFIRRQIDKNWYEGEHNAMVGIFPVNYVEVFSTKLFVTSVGIILIITYLH